MFDPVEFPYLDLEGYKRTSEPTWDYNCIGWALHDTERWWWPIGEANGKLTAWPRKAPNKVTLNAFIKAFAVRGFQPLSGISTDLELGFEKIALYALDGKPTHAARQLPTGSWTHKMGSFIDLEASLTAVQGPKYGLVVRVFRRKI